MNGSNLSKLVRTEPVRKEQGGRWPSEKNKNEKVAHRTEKEALQCPRENRKKKQPEEKEATRNVKKGRMTLKRSKWRKA